MEALALIPFVLSVVTISLSGALMPGPVTAVTVAGGAKSPHAGAWVAVGHGLIEFPLMALIYFGAGALFQIAAVKIGIGFAGGLVLAWMGIGMIREYDRAELASGPATRARSPLASGLLLSAGNPYFLIWWATAGAVLVQKSLAFGIIGFFILAAAHWLCDFVWLYLLSALSFKGGKFFGRKLQQAVFIVCGLVLIAFAGYFAIGAAITLAGPA